MADFDPQADAEAFSKQYDADKAAKAQREASTQQPPSAMQRFAPPKTPVTPSIIDSALAEAEAWGTAAKRVGQDVAAGAATAVVNTAEQVGRAASTSGKGLAAAEDPEHEAQGLPTSPIWDHARSTILDFRDAVAVKDPNLVDNLTQAAAQLAIPFMGYSRMLSGIHGIANVAAAGAVTDATALAPHDPRMADVLSMGRQTEGKFGEVLRTLAPDGSALNAYINFLSDRRGESEALGTFKNVLDGFGVNMIVTPLLGAVATTLKQGTAGLRYAIENGVGSAGDFMPVGAKAQRGAVGDLGKPRPAANNASGESAASLEAQNWVKANKTAGVKVLRIDPDGQPMELPGIEGRDPVPLTGHPVIQLHQDGTHELIERGGMTKLAAEGLVNRFKARAKIGLSEKE